MKKIVRILFIIFLPGLLGTLFIISFFSAAEENKYLWTNFWSKVFFSLGYTGIPSIILAIFVEWLIRKRKNFKVIIGISGLWGALSGLVISILKFGLNIENLIYTSIGAIVGFLVIVSIIPFLPKRLWMEEGLVKNNVQIDSFGEDEKSEKIGLAVLAFLIIAQVFSYFFFADKALANMILFETREYENIEFTKREWVAFEYKGPKYLGPNIEKELLKRLSVFYDPIYYPAEELPDELISYEIADNGKILFNSYH